MLLKLKNYTIMKVNMIKNELLQMKTVQKIILIRSSRQHRAKQTLVHVTGQSMKQALRTRTVYKAKCNTVSSSRECHIFHIFATISRAGTPMIIISRHI